MNHFGNQALCSFSSTKSLETVDITGWSISDYAIEVLAENNPNLKNLNISFCYGITEDGIQVRIFLFFFIIFLLFFYNFFYYFLLFFYYFFLYFFLFFFCILLYLLNMFSNYFFNHCFFPEFLQLR